MKEEYESESSDGADDSENPFLCGNNNDGHESDNFFENLADDEGENDNQVHSDEEELGVGLDDSKSKQPPQTINNDSQAIALTQS